MVYQIAVTGISIHAPRGGSDRANKTSAIDNGNFNPRSPWGERRFGLVAWLTEAIISIHAPRGGSDEKIHYKSTHTHISIHAPRGGSDTQQHSGLH